MDGPPVIGRDSALQPRPNTTDADRFFDSRPVGYLVGRPDLSEEEVLAAIAERLAFDGRTGPEPQVVIEAARLGKRKALAFLRKLVLPPPRAPLAMPVRPILREHLTQGVGEGH